MSKLILIKHAHSQITPTIPSKNWPLSNQGQALCIPLAAKLTHYAPTIIISSLEPKAMETASLTANILQIPFKTAPNLHEHDRSKAAFFNNVAQFQATVAALLAQPDQLIYGSETANQAHHRFNQAVNSLLKQHANQTLAVVSHGTVISLLVSRRLNLDPFPLWQSLSLPSFIVLKRPALSLIKIIKTVEG